MNNRSEPTALTRAMGDRIHRARRVARMSQTALAKEVGYQDGSSITFIEQGRNSAKPDVLLEICDVLGMSPNELFGWKDKV
jgi:transcriptional regulator with XRE-family HTH domain